jgi:hypothetical protein
MSRDKRLSRTQEVVGSIPISSTNRFAPRLVRVFGVIVIERGEVALFSPPSDRGVRFRTR